MRITVTIGIAAAVAALALGASLDSAVADPAASHVIDRTFSCALAAKAGVRRVEVSARTGTRLLGDVTKWKFLASAAVRDPLGGIAGVSAGNPLAALEPGFPASPERLSLIAGSKCRTLRERLPLTTRGLGGFAASPLEDTYDCASGRRVRVRVRGEFAGSASLGLKRYRDGSAWWVARGTVVRGVLAVATEEGTPLALAEVFASGKARLFLADRCTPHTSYGIGP
jgi:hypothetical protein